MTQIDGSRSGLRPFRTVVAICGALLVGSFFLYIAIQNVIEGDVEAMLGALTYGAICCLPLILALRVPRGDLLAVFGVVLMIALNITVFIQFFQDEHSTAGLRLLSAISGSWLLWGLSVGIDLEVQRWSRRRHHDRGDTDLEAGAQSSGAGRAR